MQDAQEFARQKLGECGSGSFRSKERKAHSVVERFKTEWCAEGIPGSSVCLEHKIKEQECRRGYNFRNEVAEGKGQTLSGFADLSFFACRTLEGPSQSLWPCWRLCHEGACLVRCVQRQLMKLNPQAGGGGSLYPGISPSV